MDITFINKHRFGIVALLFFILLVSQEKSIRFLINTILGRFSLILLILGITSFNVILGIMAVIFVIVMVNKDNYLNLEAFNPNNLTDEQEDNLKQIKDKLKNNKNQQDTITNTSISAATNATTETFRGGGREGFNTTDRERNIQLGKKANEISTGNINQNAENVEPFDNYMLSSTPSNI